MSFRRRVVVLVLMLSLLSFCNLAFRSIRRWQLTDPGITEAPQSFSSETSLVDGEYTTPSQLESPNDATTKSQKSSATVQQSKTNLPPTLAPQTVKPSAKTKNDSEQLRLRSLFGVQTISEVELEDILPKAAPGDTTGFATVNDPRRYFICSFLKSCVNSTNWMFVVKDPTQRAIFNGLRHECYNLGDKRLPHCKCFNQELEAIFISEEHYNRMRVRRGHHWVVDTWVRNHQISHWAEKIVLTHSIFTHADDYRLPPVSGFVFPKYTLPISDHESQILKLGLAPVPLGVNPATQIFRAELDLNEGLCFEQASLPPTMAVIAQSQSDADAFRTRALTHFGLPRLKCPPRRVVLLYRSDHPSRSRKIINMQELRQALVDEGISFPLESYTVGAGNSSYQQAQLFAKFGLMISSHSSQLVNCLFSQQTAAIIEVAPAFFNFDFAEMAIQMGNSYTFALGGHAQDAPAIAAQDSIVSECQNTYLACNTDPACLKKLFTGNSGKPCRGLASKYYQWTKHVKHPNFSANITAVKIAIRQALTHLNEACEGDWRANSPIVPLDPLSQPSPPQ